MAEVLKNFKDWLSYEKEDLKDGFGVYPKRKILFLALGISVLFWVTFNLWLAVNSGTIGYWDSLVVNQIKLLRTPLLDKFFSFLTDFASGIFIAWTFLLLAIFLGVKRRKRAAMAVLVTLLGSAIFIKFLNNFLGRPRPFGCIRGMLGKSCFSFPSGHAGGAFYFYGMLFYLIARFGKLKKPFVLLLGVGLAGLISLIGLSRVYLGFHFPTDVMAGFLLGGIFLLAGIILIDFFYQTK